MNRRDFEKACKNLDVEKLISALNDRRVDNQEQAAFYLGKSKDSVATDSLLNRLKEADKNVTESCIKALGEIGDSKAVDTLLEFIDNNWFREFAAESLGKIGDKKAVLPLLKKLESSPDYYSRELLIPIGRLGDKRAVPFLTRMIKNPFDNDLQISIMTEKILLAAEALCLIGDESSIQPILKFLSSFYDEKFGTYWEDIYRLKEPLINLGAKLVDPLINAYEELEDTFDTSSFCAFIAAVLGEIESEKSVSGLTKIAEDGSPYVRETALKSLGNLKKIESVTILIDYFKKKNDSREFFIRAAEGLGKSEDKRAIDFLVSQLEKPLSKDKYFYAAYGLSIIKDERALKPLLEALQNSNVDIWRLAQKGLINLGAIVIKSLNNLLESIDDEEDHRVTEILSEIGSQDSFLQLSERVKNNDYNVSKRAFLTLGKFGKVEAMEFIKPFYETNARENKWDLESTIQFFFDNLELDSDSIPKLLSYISIDYEDEEINNKVRFEIAQKINGMEIKPEYYELFPQLAKEENYYIKEALIDVLKRFENVDALDIIISFLDDEHQSVIRKAVEALGYITDIKTLPLLLQKVGSRYRLVQEAAVEAIKQFEEENLADKLIEFLNLDEVDLYNKRCVLNFADKLSDDIAIDFLTKTILSQNLNFKLTALKTLELKYSDKINEKQLNKLKAECSEAKEKFEKEKIAELTQAEIDLHIQNKDLDGIFEAISKKQIGYNNGCLAILNFKDENSFKRFFDEIRRNVPDSSVAIYGLETLITEESIDILLEALDDKNQSVVEVAANIIETLHMEKTSIEVLLPFLKHSNSQVRESIVIAMCKKIKEEHISNILEVLKNGDEKTKLSVLEIFTNFRPKEAIPILLEMSETTSMKIKTKITDILTYYGVIYKDARVVNRLLEFLDDQYYDVRDTAVKSLERIGSPLALKPVIEIINDDAKINFIYPNPDYHSRIMYILHRMGEPIVPYLLEFLKLQAYSSNKWKVTTAARMLKEFRTNKVIKDLKKLAKGSSFTESRIEALKSLKGMGVSTEEILKEIVFKSEEDTEIRLYAAEELEKLNLGDLLKPIEEELTKLSFEWQEELEWRAREEEPWNYEDY